VTLLNMLMALTPWCRRVWTLRLRGGGVGRRQQCHSSAAGLRGAPDGARPSRPGM